MAIYLYTGAKFSLSGTAAEAVGSFDPLSTAMQLTVLGTGLVMAALAPRAVLARLWAAVPMLLLVAVAAGSALWSVSPEHSIRRSVSLVALLVFIATTHAAIGARRFMAITTWTLVAIAVLCLLEALARPGVGLDTGDYANAVRGIYPAKNAFGMALLQGALALSFLVLARGRVTLPDMLAVGVLMMMLVLSRATGALVLAVLTGAVTLALVFFDQGGLRRGLVMLGLGVAALGLLVLAVLGTEVLFDLLGKDSTLTGRTVLWEALAPVIAARPLLGAGYAAFWLEQSSEVQRVWRAIQWAAPNAHSGYLDLLLQLGLLGMAGAGLAALLALGRAVAGLWGSLARRARSRWALIYLAVLANLSFNESLLLNPDLFTGFLALTLLSALPEPGEAPAARRVAAAPPPRPVARPGLAMPGLVVPVRPGQRFGRWR